VRYRDDPAHRWLRALVAEVAAEVAAAGAEQPPGTKPARRP